MHSCRNYPLMAIREGDTHTHPALCPRETNVEHSLVGDRASSWGFPVRDMRDAAQWRQQAAVRSESSRGNGTSHAVPVSDVLQQASSPGWEQASRWSTEGKQGAHDVLLAPQPASSYPVERREHGRNARSQRARPVF